MRVSRTDASSVPTSPTPSGMERGAPRAEEAAAHWRTPPGPEISESDAPDQVWSFTMENS